MWFLRHVQMNTQTDSHTCLSQYCAPLLGQSNNTQSRILYQQQQPDKFNYSFFKSVRIAVVTISYNIQFHTRTQVFLNQTRVHQLPHDSPSPLVLKQNFCGQLEQFLRAGCFCNLPSNNVKAKRVISKLYTFLVQQMTPESKGKVAGYLMAVSRHAYTHQQCR